MIQILKANLIRLFRNYLYIGGLVVAAVLTYYISRADAELFVLHHISHNECMKLVCGAVYAFIAIFVPVFQGTEFSDGVIRNKFIMGHTAGEFYLAHLLTSFIMMAVMEGVWILSGLLAGASMDADLLGFIVLTVFAMFSYCAFMTFLQMLIRHASACAGIGVLLFYGAFFMGLIGNYLFSFHGDRIATKIILFLVNIQPTGEWFLHSYLHSSEINDFGYYMSYGLIPHLIICICMMAVFSIFGIRSLETKDLK